MNYKKAIIIFITVITALRLIYINLIPLLGDEAYYWQWSRHLAPGYYEQGPVLALVIWLFTLFNKINTIFTVRLGAVTLSLFTMILSVLIYKKLYPGKSSDKESFFSLLFINSSLIYSLGAVLMMHDTVMIFFYALFIYQMLFVIQNPDNNKYWAGAGAILALGVMSKYTLAVIYPAVIIFLLAARLPKKYIKGPLLFSLFFTIFLAPVIYWNITHDFATIKYLLIRGESEGFHIRYFFELITGQAALISVFLIPFMIMAFTKKIKNPAFTPDFFLALIFAVPFAMFVVLSFFTKIEANWPAFAFLPLFFVTTRFLFTRFYGRPLVFHGVYSAGFLILAVVYLHAAFSVLPVPEKLHPLKKARGYKTIAQKADKLIENHNGKNFFIATRHYQKASLLSFYMKGQPEVYIPVRHKSSKNYRFWLNNESLKGKNCFFFWNEQWEKRRIRGLFSSVKTIGYLSALKSGKEVRSLKADYCRGYLGRGKK